MIPFQFKAFVGYPIKVFVEGGRLSEYETPNIRDIQRAIQSGKAEVGGFEDPNFKAIERVLKFRGIIS